MITPILEMKNLRNKKRQALNPSCLALWIVLAAITPYWHYALYAHSNL